MIWYDLQKNGSTVGFPNKHSMEIAWTCLLGYVNLGKSWKIICRNLSQARNHACQPRVTWINWGTPPFPVWFQQRAHGSQGFAAQALLQNFVNGHAETMLSRCWFRLLIRSARLEVSRKVFPHATFHESQSWPWAPTVTQTSFSSKTAGHALTADGRLNSGGLIHEIAWVTGWHLSFDQVTLLHK